MMPAVRHVIHNHLKSLGLLPVPVTMCADDIRVLDSAESPWLQKFLINTGIQIMEAIPGMLFSLPRV